MILFDYHIKQKAFRTSSALFSYLEGSKANERGAVWIKVANPGEHYQQAVRLLRRETETVKALPPGISPVFRVHVGQEAQEGLIFEAPEGRFLSELRTADPSDPKQVIAIGLQLLDALEQLHRQQVLHLAIRPENIVWNPQKENVLFWGLEYAQAPGEAGITPADANLSIPFSPWMAPEQTGNLSRRPDERTDLYGFGATLYFLLAGAPPVEDDPDPLKLTHRVLASPAPDLSGRGCPPVLSRIVARLLNKSPEQRYQSIQGVRWDLQQLLKAPERTDFTIGRHDKKHVFRPPDRLFGRTEELEAITQAYERAREGAANLLVLEGPSGIGKSSLWRTFVENRKKEKGFFARGRFEEFNRDIPYQGWMEAFGTVLRTLLTEDQAALSDWKSKIESAVGGNLDLFQNSLPELRFFVDRTEQQGDLLPVYLKSRFQLIVKEFIKLFCQPGAPLVLFLDNIQWADGPSLDLITAVLADPSVQNFLIIAGHGTDAGPQRKALTHKLRHASPDPRQIQTLRLAPMAREDVVQWMQAFLTPSIGDLKELAAIAQQKTGGNPFYLRSWFDSLYSTGLIKWNTERLAWRWDAGEISSADVPANMTDLVMANVRNLATPALGILHTASCLGKNFTSGFLAQLTETVPATIVEQLGPAMELNIIQKVRKNGASGYGTEEQAKTVLFKFTHDKIQSALYRGLPPAERSLHHTKAALLLLERANGRKDRRDLFSTSYHLLHGQSSYIPAARRLPAARQLILAGRKTMRTGAFPQALNYFRKAAELVHPADWGPHFDELFGLYTGMGECQFILGDLAKAQAHFDRVVHAAADPYAKARVLYLQMRLYNYFENLAEGHRKALEGLRLLGQSYNDRAAVPLVARKLGAILLRLSPKKAGQLLRSPRRAPKEKALAIDFLIEISAFNYDKNPTYSFLPILEILKITLKHGLAEGSPFAIAALGGVHLLFLNSAEKARRLWDIALRILDELPSRTQAGRVHFIIYGAMQNILVPVRQCIPKLRKNYHTSLREGDLYWAYSSVVHAAYFMLNIGRRLSELADFVENLLKTDFAKVESSIRFVFINLRMIGEYVASLRDGRTATPVSSHHLEKLTELNNKAAIFLYHFLNTALGYYSGAHTLALDSGRKAAALLEWAQANSLYQDFLLLHGVILTEANLRDASAARQPAQKKLRGYHRRMKDFARKGPCNFKAKELILRGLIDLLKGRKREATQWLIQAKFTAEEYAVLPDAAIAAEWAGRVKLELGERIGAAGLLQEAYALYKRWENTQATNRLLRTYPGLIFGQPGAPGDEARDTPVVPGKAGATDSPLSLATIERVSMALAAERRQKPLMEKFLALIMENTGASSAAYFSCEEGRFRLEAKADVNTPSQRQAAAIPLEELSEFPQKVIRFVGRTQEYLVLDHPEADPRFSEESFPQTDPPLSVLCYPLSHGGRLQGILYAENKFIPGAFTQENLQLLKLLSGQMSLSIENARAHEMLEAKVEERTVALHREQKRSENLLLNILPQQVAEELKEKNKATPRYYPEATVLFTDFVDFTRHAEGLSPQQLVSLLDEYFSAFDDICERRGIEKIKTIGDAFLCVGGLPVPSRDHAVRVVEAARDMIAYVKGKHEAARTDGGDAFEIRIGIHSGPLVAGVVGLQKFSYDIWGDTVNIAYRMEEKSAAGHINISAATQELVAHAFDCTYRGKVEVKGKGLVDMYFLANDA